MKIPFLKKNKKNTLQHIDLQDNTNCHLSNIHSLVVNYPLYSKFQASLRIDIAPDAKDPSIIFPNKNNSLLDLAPGSIWDIDIQGEKVNSKRIR